MFEADQVSQQTAKNGKQKQVIPQIKTFDPKTHNQQEKHYQTKQETDNKEISSQLGKSRCTMTSATDPTTMSPFSPSNPNSPTYMGSHGNINDTNMNEMYTSPHIVDDSNSVSKITGLTGVTFGKLRNTLSNTNTTLDTIIAGGDNIHSDNGGGTGVSGPNTPIGHFYPMTRKTSKSKSKSKSKHNCQRKSSKYGHHMHGQTGKNTTKTMDTLYETGSIMTDKTFETRKETGHTAQTVIKHRHEDSLIQIDGEDNTPIIELQSSLETQFMSDSAAKYATAYQQGEILREMNQEYQVHLDWPGLGSTDVTVPPSTITGLSIKHSNGHSDFGDIDTPTPDASAGEHGLV